MLPRVVLVVADEEVPAHRFVLGRERMKGRHVVVFRQRVSAGALRIGALERLGSPPASSSSTLKPDSASRAATVPPPAPEPTTM